MISRHSYSRVAQHHDDSLRRRWRAIASSWKNLLVNKYGRYHDDLQVSHELKGSTKASSPSSPQHLLINLYKPSHLNSRTSTTAKMTPVRCSTTSSMESDPESPTHNRFTPSSPITHNPTSSPTAIIISSWPYAQSQQIDRYTRGYECLYPQNRIIVLRPSSSTRQKFTSPNTHEEFSISEALDVLTQSTAGAEQKPSYLLHVFGNASAALACDLLQAHKARTGTPIPLRTMILDTTPGLHLPSRRLLSVATLHTLLLYLFHLLIHSVSLFSFRDMDTSASRIRKDLHDENLVGKKVHRCYVHQGLVFSWEKEERKEFKVHREKIDEHTRWNGDEERYWMAIEDAWERRS